jgi:hypothetical protein
VVPNFNLPGGEVPTEAQCLQNPLPVGATWFKREMIEGNQSQSSPTLHFGLDQLPFERKIVDCVRVAWPSGLVTAYTGLTANSKVVLAEDAGHIKVVNVVPNAGPNTVSNRVTVTGLHFQLDLNVVPTVLFGGVPAPSVVFVSEHELTVMTPLGQTPGVVSITVTNPDGDSDTLPLAYTFTGSGAIRFKDPYPSLDMLTATGQVSSDPSVVAVHGVDRTGAQADGVTKLVFEYAVESAGTVHVVLDDDSNPNSPVRRSPSDDRDGEHQRR